jgi:hypothetical protein
MRVDGKPMLIVYRSNVMPDLSATLLRWRELFREEGIGEVHLLSAMTFGYERGVEDRFRNSRRTGSVAGFRASGRNQRPNRRRSTRSPVRSGRHANSSSPPVGTARRV